MSSFFRLLDLFCQLVKVPLALAGKACSAIISAVLCKW